MESEQILSLEEQAAIEREREAIYEHARVTFDLLPIGKSTVDRISRFSSSPMAPHQNKSATLRLQLGEFSANLFNAEAKHYLKYAKDEAELRSWLQPIAARIGGDVARDAFESSQTFHCSEADRRKAISDALIKRVDHWVEKKQSEIISRASGPQREAAAPTPVRGRMAFSFDPPGNSPDEVTQKTPSPSEEVQRRINLLANYKAATGNPSNRQIYTSSNSGIHKPQFHEWLRGDLASSRKTSIKFEKFLQAKKRPIPRTPES
jgi:hypothetical protein